MSLAWLIFCSNLNSNLNSNFDSESAILSNSDIAEIEQNVSKISTSVLERAAIPKKPAQAVSTSSLSNDIQYIPDSLTSLSPIHSSVISSTASSSSISLKKPAARSTQSNAHRIVQQTKRELELSTCPSPVSSLSSIDSFDSLDSLQPLLKIKPPSKFPKKHYVEPSTLSGHPLESSTSTDHQISLMYEIEQKKS